MSDSGKAKATPEPVDLRGRLSLNLEEAARAFGVSEKHLRNLLPEIPHVRLGNRLVIPVKPAEEWLRQQAKAERASADQMAEDVLREFQKK